MAITKIEQALLKLSKKQGLITDFYPGMKDEPKAEEDD